MLELDANDEEDREDDELSEEEKQPTLKFNEPVVPKRRETIKESAYLSNIESLQHEQDVVSQRAASSTVTR